MKKALLLATALTMVVAALAWCQPPAGPGGPGGQGGRGGPGARGGPGGPGGPGGHAPSVMAALLPPPAGAVDGIARALELTTEQAAQLKAILTASDTTIQPLMKTAADATRAVRDALVAEDFDAMAVVTLAAAAQTAEADVISASVGVWTQVRSDATLALTADQVAKLMMGPGRGAPPPGPPPAQNSGTATNTRRR